MTVQNIRTTSGLTFRHNLSLSLSHFQWYLDQYQRGTVRASSDCPTVEIVSECQT